MPLIVVNKPKSDEVIDTKDAVVAPRYYDPTSNGVLQSDGQTAQLLNSLITEVQAMRASTERTASAIEGNQSVPLLVEIAQ